MKKWSILILLVSFLLMSLISGCGGSGGGGSNPTPVITTLINYPMTISSGGDLLTRAFYITAYPGTTLSKVTLYFSQAISGEHNHSIYLFARDSAFNGTSIGSATASFTLYSNSSYKAVTFNFNNVAVTKGHIVTFKFGVDLSLDSLFFCNTGNTGGTTSIVYETNGILPPLDTKRKDSIAIKVEGQN